MRSWAGILKIDEDTGLLPQFVSDEYRLAGNRRNHRRVLALDSLDNGAKVPENSTGCFTKWKLAFLTMGGFQPFVRPCKQRSSHLRSLSRRDLKRSMQLFEQSAVRRE